MALAKPNFERADLRSSTANRNTWLAAGLLITALAAWCALVRATPWLPASIDLQVPQVARTLSAGLFLTAGVLWLVRWWLTDDQQSARTGAAFILLGLALPVVALVGPLMQSPPELAQGVPAGRLLLLLPVLALVAAGSRSSGHAIRPLPVVVILFAAWAVVTTVLAEWHWVSARLPMDVPQVWLVAECAAGATWLLLASGAWRQGRSEGRPTRNWTAVALLLMGLCELLKAHSIADRPAEFGLGPGLQALAAAIVAIVAAAEFRDAYRIYRGRSVALAHALVDVQQQLADVQQSYRERLHDARSAVIGVVGASRLLSEAATPAVADPRRLHDLMAAELGRLQDTLDTDSVEPLQEFALTDVLESVVLSHRLAGGVVDVELGVVRVVGRPTATATAVANLLANARVHAPGAHVNLHAERQGSTVVVLVDDNGAGIPASERERLLLPGVRGSTSAAGSGLGLHTAAAAMTGQAGSLRLTERPGGGTRAVMTMTAAAHHRLTDATSSRADAS